MTAALKIEDEQTPASREEIAAMLTGRFREAVENMPAEIAAMDLMQLENARKPAETDQFLRENLWKQVDLVKKGLKSEIAPVEVYRGVVSRTGWEQRVLTEPIRVAYLLTYPNEDKHRMRIGLSLGMTNLIKFVAKEPTPETVGAFIKAMEFLMNRVHGPVVQRIETKNANLNINHQAPPPPPQPQLKSPEPSLYDQVEAQMQKSKVPDPVRR